MQRSNAATVISESAEVISRIESGDTCPMFKNCRDFLDPGHFIECAKSENLCSKSETVTKKMLCEILQKLQCQCAE